MSIGTRHPLVVAAARPRSVPYDVAVNGEAHAEIVRATARVVVFPELSLTGYELDAPVGAPVASDDRDHIAMIAVEGNGATVAHRKMWLSEAESLRFRPGDIPAVMVVDGWRLGLAICKDTGIAQHASDTAVQGFDVYVAGVLDSAGDATIQDRRARRVAAEHHVWVVVASFAGSTGGGYEHAAARATS